MAYDPYSQAPAYSSGGPDLPSDSGRAWDPYTGRMTGGSDERNMTPGKPITQTSFASVPTREGGGSLWDVPHLSQEEPARRVRGAMRDAFLNTAVPTPEGQALRERMKVATGVGPWLMRNAVLPVADTANAVVGGISALGAGAGETGRQLAIQAGVPESVLRDVTALSATAPVVVGGAGPLSPARVVPPLEERGPRFTGRLQPGDVRPPGEVKPAGPVEATGIPGRMEPPPGYVPPVDVLKTAAEGKARAGEYFDIARDKGGTLQPGYVDLHLDDLLRDQKRLKEGSNVTGDNVVTKAIDSLQNQRGQPLTLQAAWNIDKWLGKQISDEYTPGGLSEYGRELQGIQRRLKEHIDNAGEGDIQGGKEGFEALKTGRQAFTVAARMADLERMEEIAGRALNPQQRLRTLIDQYVSNEGKVRGWSDADLASLKEAGKRGTTQEVMASLSSRLLGIGATATAGPLAGVATTVATKAARDALTSSHMQQIQALRERFGLRLPPAPNQPGAVPGPALMPRFNVPGTLHPGLLAIPNAVWGDTEDQRQ